MQKIISVATMRASDAAEIAGGTDSKTLMYRAGLGLFRSYDWHGSIDIVAGSGNNAGDGYVLALLLHDAGISCRIVLTSEKFSPDGAYYFEKCRNADIPVTRKIDFSHTDIIVDCLLGTGFKGELRPNLRQVVEQINASHAFVISVDINSGMNGDTGEGFFVRSDLTVSIGMLKSGHLLGMAKGAIQKLYNYDIGIPCIGTYMPLYAPDETPEEHSSNFSFPAQFHEVLDSVGIPGGSPEERLQAYAHSVWERIQFFQVTDSQ
ncbi:MAG: NAD(P)H-hydrate epimerase [Ruminococcus sp.]